MEWGKGNAFCFALFHGLLLQLNNSIKSSKVRMEKGRSKREAVVREGGGEGRGEKWRYKKCTCTRGMGRIFLVWDLGRGEGECVGGDEGGEREGGRRGRGG